MKINSLRVTFKDEYRAKLNEPNVTGIEVGSFLEIVKIWFNVCCNIIDPIKFDSVKIMLESVCVYVAKKLKFI